MPVIDIHNHFTPIELVAALRNGEFDGFTVVETDGRIDVRIDGRGGGVQGAERTDVNSRLADMDAAGIDIQALSLMPPLFGYQLPVAQGIRLTRLVNDAIAKAVLARRDRFVALAVVPLQDPRAAADELRRAVTELGMAGVEIGANANGVELGDASLLPFWETVADLDTFVFVHPNWTNIPARERMKGFHLHNIIGNPLDTSLSIASLIFNGHLERWPNLKVCFAHAGGFVPYQIGRFDHAYRVRPEAQRVIPQLPSVYFKRLYFDTISHDVDALEYLIKKAGPGQVLLGTDYPADMADAEPVRTIESVSSLSASDANAIKGETSRALLKIPR